jgi:pyruvate/2-oxoglutarate dehydrogenase complex dihydrolipoamide dehydrogenase (E3) component
MAEVIDVDICIIGAGSGGLSVAAGASQLGAKTVLIEKGEMGGDCLNTGCVPSKALIAAAHAAHAQRSSGKFGIAPIAEPKVDFKAVHKHVHGVIAAIAPVDSEARFTGMGVNVIRETACFTGPGEVTAGAQKIKAKRFVIATGSRPFVPPIDGLGDISYLTNESIFDLTECPEHLIVIGGGPIGCELAQAFRRLGAKVTIVEMDRLMGKDDPEMAAHVVTRLEAEGIDVREGTGVTAVAQDGDKLVATVKQGDEESQVQGSHLLVSAGRVPVTDGLGLDAAGVEHGRRGITVDAGLRTTNKRIYAVGDVSGGPQFTHVAGYHAGVLIRRILFRMFWAKTDYRALPWVTYTDPELAHVGLTEEQAIEKMGKISVLRWSFAENDRAQAERAIDGHLKVIVDKSSRPVGATIVGAHAGELIQPWILAIQNRMKMGKMAGYIAPYPTLGEVNKRAASSYFMPKLFSEKTRRLVRLLLKLG